MNSRVEAIVQELSRLRIREEELTLELAALAEEERAQPPPARPFRVGDSVKVTNFVPRTRERNGTVVKLTAAYVHIRLVDGVAIRRAPKNVEHRRPLSP